MKRLVIQSFRRQDVPPWIERCMASVRSWAEARGYDYRFADDSSFDLVGADYLARAEGNLRTITNLTRLILIRDALAAGYDEAVWMDADIFVFAPDQFELASPQGYAFARETWIDQWEGDVWRAIAGVNNSVALFGQEQPDLQFLIDAIFHIAGHRPLRPVRGNYQVGGDLLKGLWNSLAFSALDNVGMFSPDVIRALKTRTLPVLKAQARYHGTEVHAANLCGSRHYLRAATPAQVTGAMDRLERSQGRVVNRWLAEGALPASRFEGRTFFALRPGIPAPPYPVFE